MATQSVRQSWLPHLAGGASVWRLADDLNAAELMDGRLLVPTVLGPEELPDEVQWNHTGLVPLAEAHHDAPEAVRRGLGELWACLERTQELFEQDGYEDFERAFTLPAVELDGGAHYFWRPVAQKVVVQNWGASPRSHRGREVVVFDRLRWDELRRGAEAFVGIGQAPLSGTAPAPTSSAEVDRRRHRRWIGLGLLGLGAAAATAWATRRPPEEPAPKAPASTPPPPPPPSTPVSAAPAPPIPRPHQTILFAMGRDLFDDSQLASLEAIRAYLEEHPQVTRLRIEGHADYLGLEHENQPLSRNRARRVARWLVAHGVDEARLVPVGCSERYPLDRAESADARRRNRRVEFFVLEPAGVEGPPPHPDCDP